MRKIMGHLWILSLVVAVTFGMTGCTSKASQIQDTLSEFEYSCRNSDVNVILNCIDPDVADPIRIAIALFSTMTGEDYENIVDGLFDHLEGEPFGASFDAKRFLSTISFSDEKLKTKKNTAKVTCKMNFEVAGVQFTRDTVIDMVKLDGKWYIAGFDLFSDNK